MTVSEPWTCPACGSAVVTPYCGACGERPRDPHGLTLRGLVLLVFHAFTSLDGKVFRSFRRLVARPGELSLAFVQGVRVRDVGPFQLFVFANVAFFALESLTRISVLSSPLASHMQQQDWQQLATRMVERKLAASHTTLADYAPTASRSS